jgi:hypothetical protein
MATASSILAPSKKEAADSYEFKGSLRMVERELRCENVLITQSFELHP